MKIYLGTDHGGYELKEKLKVFLAELGFETVDMGTHTPNPGDDYPDFIFPAVEAVVGDSGSLGIVLGRSGNGEQIAANKVKGIRAALCLTNEMAKKAREHNDANVLAIGADLVSKDEAIDIVKTFIKTPFSGNERHVRRLQKIADYEAK